MIDEKKFMEFMSALEEAGSKYVSFDDLRKFVDDFPKISIWIPCSERLPEESLNSVIGWDAYRKRPCFVQRRGGRWILGDDIDFVHITAWQPLPEPYKPESEGQAE